MKPSHDLFITFIHYFFKFTIHAVYTTNYFDVWYGFNYSNMCFAWFMTYCTNFNFTALASHIITA